MIYLGFGSNIGDRRAHFKRAIELLSQKGVVFHQFSHLYTTPPWGIEEQESFLNGAAAATFPDGDPESLMNLILETEQEMGRHRQVKWGPRLIDIDILDYEGLIWATTSLLLPHPWLHKRSFVLLPLADLRAEWRPVGLPNTIQEYLDAFPKEELEKVERIIVDPASPIAW